MAALLLLLMSGCADPDAPPVLPEGPDGLVAASPGAFASSALAVQERAVSLAQERLAAFGPLARQPLRAWPANRSRAELITSWDQLLTAQGFERMETGLATLPDFLGPGTWLAAWRRDGQMVALVGQTTADPGVPMLPVTVLTGRR